MTSFLDLSNSSNMTWRKQVVLFPEAKLLGKFGEISLYNHTGIVSYPLSQFFFGMKTKVKSLEIEFTYVRRIWRKLGKTREAVELKTIHHLSCQSLKTERREHQPRWWSEDSLEVMLCGRHVRVRRDVKVWSVRGTSRVLKINDVGYGGRLSSILVSPIV